MPAEIYKSGTIIVKEVLKQDFEGTTRLHFEAEVTKQGYTVILVGFQDYEGALEAGKKYIENSLW